jgi:hypothetical protein
MLTTSLPAQTEILLLCDSAKLARVIELILQDSGHIQTLLIDPPTSCLTSAKYWDLILLVFSEPAEGRLDALRHADLIQWGTHQPMLVLAPVPFACPPGEQISYLEFPCNAQTLSNRVAKILAGPRAGLSGR